MEVKNRKECHKCKYYVNNTHNHTCDYILRTGRSRGCDVEDCDKWKTNKRR